MKKLVVFASALAAGMAMASSVSSTQTFGVLKVDTTLQQTIISVPWVAAGTGSAVKVRDFVKTTGLAEGTILYKYYLDNGVGKFKGWVLDNGDWVGLNSVTFSGKTVAPGADDTLSQQDALFIVRTDGDYANDPNCSIYLYGQYNDASDLTYSIDRSTGAALVSPVNTSGAAINLNSKVTWGSENPPKQGDLIKLHTAGGSAPTYRYDSTRDDGKYWGRKVNGQWEEAVVQPGMGFWYTPVDGSGTTTFTLK